MRVSRIFKLRLHVGRGHHSERARAKVFLSTIATVPGSSFRIVPRDIMKRRTRCGRHPVVAFGAIELVSRALKHSVLPIQVMLPGM